MTDKAFNLILTHSRLSNKHAPYFNLEVLLYLGGVKVYLTKFTPSEDYTKLPLIYERFDIVNSIKAHLEERLELGVSEQTIRANIYHVRQFWSYCEDCKIALTNSDEIEKAYFLYSENLFQKQCRNEIKIAYSISVQLGTILAAATNNLKIHVNNTRLQKPKRYSRAISREADKTNLTDASKFGSLIYDISENFDPKVLVDKKLPIYVKVRSEIVSEGQINLTPHIRTAARILDKSLVFPFSPAKSAFNTKVASECLFFIAMTTCNPQSAFNLLRDDFIFKPLGETYQVRLYKHRRGGEVLFTIPKIYRIKFESYINFINDYANESIWLFPHIDLDGKFTKRNPSRWDPIRAIVKRFELPWIKPLSFRKIGLNLLLRLSANESFTSEIGNHAIETFRENYELPSQQRALVEITRFWDNTDPLALGSPSVSLFNTYCGGNPESEENRPEKTVEPNCLTPSGCFWCKHFRDENSFDYIWNLYSYRLLKIIESSSYLHEITKPANLVLERLNEKLDWFRSSNSDVHKKWILEAELRIDEAYYHPSWDMKIRKYEC